MQNKQSSTWFHRLTSTRGVTAGSVLLFVVLVAAVGGGLRLFSSGAVTGHHSECTSFSVSKTTVPQGTKTITSKVTMKNDGTSTWSPSYGFYLGTIGPTDWHLSGNTINPNVGPGGSRTFNVTAQVPSSAGSYSFQPSIVIVYTPVVNYCTAKTITVAGKPKVSITSPKNGSTVRGTVAVNASASNNVPINSVQFFINGKSVGTDTGSPYGYSWNTTKTSGGTYSLSAKVTDALGQTATSSTIKVTVNNSRSFSGGGGSSTGGSSGGGSSPKAADTKPPSTPGNFRAAVDATSKSVNLSWQSSTDNVGVAGYQLQRSDNGQKSWTNLSTTISKDQTTFGDLPGFNTTYYYRIRAFDAAGNDSNYALTQVSTADFSPNSQAGADTTVTSDDQTVSVLIPSGSLSGQAFCTISVSTETLPPNINGQVAIAGPYQLVYRDNNGTVLTQFNKPFVLTAHVDASRLKGLGKVLYYGQDDNGNWKQLKILTHDKKSGADTVDLQNYTTFTVMATKKKAPLIVKILIILLIIAIFIFLARFISGRLVRRKAESTYDEYLRKAKGL